MTRHLTRHLRPLATKNLIIYAKSNGKIRRIIDGSHDAVYTYHIGEMLPGEGYLFLSHADYDAHLHPDHLQETVARLAGFAQAPHRDSDRHAIISPTGETVGFCHADPTCGDDGEHIAKGHKLVRHFQGI